MAKVALVKEEKKFSWKEKRNIKKLLSQVPSRHLKTISRIERMISLDNSNNGPLADVYRDGDSYVMRLLDDFFRLDEVQKRFVFFHEMEHCYFNYYDIFHNKDHVANMYNPTRNEARNLFRVQWMELGGWKLDQKKLKKFQAWSPGNRAYINAYNYMFFLEVPNRYHEEWSCPQESRISDKLYEWGFRYGERLYSPTEEMSDAYALYIVNPKLFEEKAKRNKPVGKKLNFIRRQFKEK